MRDTQNETRSRSKRFLPKRFLDFFELCFSNFANFDFAFWDFYEFRDCACATSPSAHSLRPIVVLSRTSSCALTLHARVLGQTVSAQAATIAPRALFKVRHPTKVSPPHRIPLLVTCDVVVSLAVKTRRRHRFCFSSESSAHCGHRKSSQSGRLC